MAEAPDDKADDTSNTNNEGTAGDQSKRKRRILRPAPAEPTTLRERSEKAQAESERPRRRRWVGKILGAPFRLIGRIFRPLGRFKVFRIIGYIFVPPYFRNSWRELRLVTWPNRTQTLQLTWAVIIFSLIFGSIVALVDFGLDKLFRAVILKH